MSSDVFLMTAGRPIFLKVTKSQVNFLLWASGVETFIRQGSLKSDCGPPVTLLRELPCFLAYLYLLFGKYAELAFSSSCLQHTNGCTDNYHWINLTVATT